MRKSACLCLLLVPLLLVGCATPLPRAPDAALDDCRGLFATLDAQVAKAGVGDADAARIGDFPWLRVDRLLASFRTSVEQGPALHAWVARLSALDEAGRTHEFSALGLPPPPRLWACRAALTEALLKDPLALARLRKRATVPDAYQGLARAFGLYPLAAPLARIGALRLQDRERPRAGIEVGPHTRAYTAGVGERPAAGLEATPLARDALGIPTPSGAQLDALFARHAPHWLVETAGPDDLPGTVQWAAQGRPTVAGPPTEYRYVSHTRFDGAVLLQLNYLLWFPARSATGPLDLLAGDFDAVIWRVTLDVDGTPLLHDSVHACGCYQLWWPGPRLGLRAGQDDTEPPWLAPAVDASGPLAVQLDAGTHYVRGVGPAPSLPTTPLAVADYDTLRRLPLPGGGTRSLFAPDGLLHASARPERFVLWPLGVPSAGAMRQRGHQATAFVGRRHFDDAFGVARYFERVAGARGRASE